MIYAPPGEAFTAVVEGLDTGLAGTLGIRVENTDGTTQIARDTAGIVEIEPGSGSYTKRDLEAPGNDGTYILLWDTGGAVPQWVGEQLRVGTPGRITAQPGETIVAVAEGFPAGLTGTLGVRVENTDGTTHTARTTAGIVEVEPGAGIYTVQLQAPDEIDAYVVLWDDGSGSFASEDLTVAAAIPDLEPSPQDVAALLRARTKDDANNYAGTFNENTRPTADEATKLIRLAASDVKIRAGATIPDELADSARMVTALRAAQLIELSYFPEQTDDRLMAYQSLRLSYEDSVGKLVHALSVRGLFSEGEPVVEVVP